MNLFVFCILFTVAFGAPHKNRVFRANGRVGITGGTITEPGEFPYMLSFQDEVLPGAFAHYCGASIYNNFTSITAATCVYGEDFENPQSLFVVAGEYNLDNESGNEQRIKVTKIVVHDDFHLDLTYNDIALLQGEKSFEFNDMVGVVTLPSPYQQSSGNCTTIGWGDFDIKTPSSPILLKVDVPIVSDEECKNDYRIHNFQDSWLCAGSEGKDSCECDNGGPLICENYLAGIVSWGYYCGLSGYPGVYTEVSYYIDWIKSNAFY
ncbi:Trypsin-1 [Armadillidium nasatum]|uniref:Trypsin-1 n=1 Tax=Armadillidium nasatum TaxID=96803 RepID=A0A5N5T3H8_9CRUS|nr:Trypsin-1 [Armadillidium nasatum]